MKTPRAGLALLALLAGCAAEIPHEEPPVVVEAEFDPSAEPSPRIPSPTDLVYDTTTGHLNIEVTFDDAGIAWDLSRFLSALDGWPASMPASATFLGEIDPATVRPDTVRVFDITDIGSPVEMTDVPVILEEGTELRIHPGRLPTWEVGHRYAVAVLGGEGGVRGTGGVEVVPSSVFWFFRSDLPLADCETCPEGFADADGDPWNGCELECTASDESVSCEDGVDNDCDGRVDDEDPDCSDSYPEYCNGRDDDRDLVVDEDFDLEADPLNCGGCGVVCPERPCSERTCVEGRCGFACEEGHEDGDGDPVNGCEEGCEAEVEMHGGCRSLTSLIDDVDVGDLEEVRLENEEVFDALEAMGIGRRDLALAWSFRTSSQVVVPFDPSIEDVHFPNDYYLSEDETHLEVPAPEGTSAEAAAFLERLNALDGYSVTAEGWMRFVGPLDGRSSNLTSTALLCMNADDSDYPPRMRRIWDAERGEVVIAPGASLHSHTRYVSLATRYLKDMDGVEIIGSHIWTILASENPVVDGEGRSNIGSVDDEDAQDLEEARLDYAELFEELGERLAMPRSYYKVGVVYTTRSVVEPVQELRQVPWTRSLGTAAVAPDGVQDPALVVPAGYATANLIGVVEGVVPGIDLLDPQTREIDVAGASEVELGFVMALPLAPPAGRSASPVVVVQHDMDGSMMDVFALADALAAEGYATIGIDLVGHGSRGVCLEDADCESGSCVDGGCAGGSLRVDGDGLPLSARRVLVPVARPFGVGDAMRQQALDLVTLVRSLAADDGPASISTVALDTSDVSFVGAGFGAMAGAIFMAVDPAVHVAVTSGAGGNLRSIVEAAFPGELDAWLEDDLGLEAESEAYRLIRYGWSWAADQGEPGTFARHLIDMPLQDPGGGTMEPRALLVQVAGADEVIPAESMEFFAFSAGPSVYPETFEAGGHGFLLDPGDAEGEAARRQAVAFIASGGETVLPAGG